MAVISILTNNDQKGAAGRPYLSVLADKVLNNSAITNLTADTAVCIILPDPTTTMPTSPPSAPRLQLNGLSSISEDASPTTTTNPADRTAMKMNMLRKIRPPPFRHAWTFFHEKNNDNSNNGGTTADAYQDRLTTMMENIVTVKTFWEVINGFPLEQLRMKDSVHLFKRGVRPVWEDPRNVDGGAWTFRVGKSVSREFWAEVLLLAVGEQFGEVVVKGDDICGISLSRRFNSDLIMIWNRRTTTISDDGEAPSSVTGIRDVVLAQLSPHLKPKEVTCYYKKHDEHKGFSDIVAAMKKGGGHGGGMKAEVEGEEEGGGGMKVGDEVGEEVAVVEDAEAEKAMREEMAGEE
ncbi:MAG: hypothetical protein Q9219_003769 [cf. Caloplaca sp. 3 TL-2023]